MKSVFLSLVFLSFSANANVFKVEDSRLNASETAQVQSFFDKVESLLPNKILSRLSKKNVKVTFDSIDKQNNLVLPDCSVVVNSLLKGQDVSNEYFQAQKSARTLSIRYNKQTQAYLKNNDRQMVMHVGFLDPILRGKIQEYQCEHKNTYALAEAVVINMAARLYDDSYTYRTTDIHGSDIQKPGALSESLKFRFVAGWTEKELKYSYWPRALNPYEYASRPQDNFALNLEFFLLDPEYACRKPLQFDYFSRILLSENNVAYDPHAKDRNCKVNTEIRIPWDKYVLQYDSNNRMLSRENRVRLETYDLDPKHIFNAYYLRAGASDGAGSFGHAMLRLVGCGNNAMTEGCEHTDMYDLVINPRANPLELRLNGAKGFFGGYPSLFLISRMDDIQDEYSEEQLRNLYNIPLVGSETTDASGKTVKVMPYDQKQRLIWATLDQYWTYYGNYKFLTNNCADETMRLYQMSSDNADVLKLHYHVMFPYDFNKDLLKLGLVDDRDVSALEEPPSIWKTIFKMIFHKKDNMSWDEYLAKRKQTYDTSKVIRSEGFDMYEAVRYIMIKEGTFSPKQYNQTGSISDQLEKWENVLTEFEKTVDPNATLTDVQKKQMADAAFATNIQDRYDNLMKKTRTAQEKYDLTRQYILIMYYLDNKWSEKISNKAIQLAYSVAYPNGKREDSKEDALKQANESYFKVPKNIDQAQAAEVRKNLDAYSDLEASLQPFDKISVQPGYGIPLESEVVRGDAYIQALKDKDASVEVIMKSLKGVIGAQSLVIHDIRNFTFAREQDLAAWEAMGLKPSNN